MLLMLSQAPFHRRLIRAIALPIVLLLALSGISIWQIYRLLSALHWVDHTDQVISQANSTQKLLLDMETGLRGYLLAGKQEFLEPYLQAKEVIPSSLAQLKNMVSDNPMQVQRVNEIIRQQEQWQQQAIPALARKQRSEPELLNDLESRKQNIDRLRQEIALFISVEEQLRSQRSRVAKETTQFVIFSSLFLTSVVGGILAYLTRRQILQISETYEVALQTAQSKAEESQKSAIALQRSSQRLSVLHQIDQAILSNEIDEILLRTALEQLHQIVGYQQAFVAVFDLETQTAQILAGIHVSGELTPSEGSRLRLAEFAPEQTLLYGIRYVEDLSCSENLPSVLEQLRDSGLSSSLGVPLLVENTLIGELKLAATETDAFDLEAQNIAREVATQLAIALQQSRLRKQLQNELRERQQQEELFRATFNQAAVGIAHVGPTGQWLRVNQKLCEIVGYTREELLQRTFQDITHPEDLDLDLAYVQQMLANEIHTYSMEKRYLRKDRSLVWINLTVSLLRESDGQPKFFISVIEDISERKQIQASLRQSEERFRSALFNAPLPILLHTEDGEVLQVNYAWTRLSGYSYRDIPTLNDWLERAYGEQREQVQTDIDRILPLKRPTPMGEYTIHTAMGTTRIWDIYASPLQALENQRLVVAMALDITERKQAEEALRQLNVTLEQQVAQRTEQLEEKNQELEAFTYSVSHDLRAPLRTMQGFAQALLEDCGSQLDAFCRGYVDSIIDDAYQMNLLISDLLTYSRLSGTQIVLRPVSLDEVVSEALKQLTTQIREHQAQIQIESPLPSAMAHRSTLVQVVVNLISNGIKFVEPNIQPQIDIFATTERQDEIEWVKLSIVDQGIGIAPEHQGRIFLVFERLHGAESYPGTGIGLAIVRKGLERMGGRVGVASQLGQGSHFWLMLPKTTLTLNELSYDTNPPSSDH